MLNEVTFQNQAPTVKWASGVHQVLKALLASLDPQAILDLRVSRAQPVKNFGINYVHILLGLVEHFQEVTRMAVLTPFR
jgi:hypothetical protein